MKNNSRFNMFISNNFEFKKGKSFLVFLLLQVVILSICCFFLIVFPIGTIIFLILLWIVEYKKRSFLVLNIKNNKIKIFSKFNITSIDVSQITKFSYDVFGFGGKKSFRYTLYFKDRDDLVRKAFLIHYNFLGNNEIIKLLNFLNGKVVINNKSFELLDIYYKEGVYKTSFPAPAQILSRGKE